MRFSVRITRRHPDGTVARYLAEVDAESIGEAGDKLSDRVRANDLEGVTVAGKHRPVPDGAGSIGLIELDAHRIGREV